MCSTPCSPPFANTIVNGDTVDSVSGSCVVRFWADYRG